jgi:hypothetical protein
MASHVSSPLGSALLGRITLQPFHVEQVLLTTCGALVSDQILSREDGHDLVCKRCMNSRGPGVFENDTIN